MSDPTTPPPTRAFPPGSSVSHRAAGLSPESVDAEQPTVIRRGPVAGGPPSSIIKIGPAVGDHLAQFELLEYVGGGGMGKVWRARDTRLGRIVAIKVLPSDQATDPNVVLRFQNEAQSAARLDHPHVARVYHLGEDRGVPFIVFEFIDGVNIRELIVRNGPLGIDEAVGYTLQIAEGLSHAASRDVVHRDIKPSNILITPDGSAKLIDLGLARLQRFDELADNDLTASGVTLGTFDYISPEQARDPRTADVRSDIYSLGCTLFYMLTGRPPFPEGTVLQKLLQHQGDQPPDVRQLRPEVPEEIARLLRKMLAKDPRHRHQNPAELIEELLSLVEAIGLRPPAGPGRLWALAAPTKSRFWERHLPWAAPVVALIGIVLLLDFYWSSARHDEPLPPPNSASTWNKEAGSTEPPAKPNGPAGEARGGEANPRREGAKAESSMTASSASAPSAAPKVAETGRSSTASEPAGKTDSKAGAPAEVARTPAKQSGVLVVGEHEPGDRSFPTLAAACAAAATGDVIVLRYNGPREQRPLQLSAARLTIRGAEGYRPVVQFKANEGETARHGQAMLALSSGQLTLVNVAMEFDVPVAIPAENWSLVEIVGEQSLRLERVCLTLRSAAGTRSEYLADAAIFRVRGAPGADAATASAGNVSLELSDCIARGEATLLRVETAQQVQFQWENGFLASGDYLLTVDGVEDAPKSGDGVDLRLRHITAAVRRGLVRGMTSQSAPHALPIRVRCVDSILQGSPGAALIEQVCVEAADECRRALDWNGDHNFYLGWESYWTVTEPEGRLPPETMDFDAWQNHWSTERESRAQVDRAIWVKLPTADRAPSRILPGDYQLSAESTNPARAAASDGDDVGAQWKRLPALGEAEAAPAKPSDALRD